MSSLRLQTFKKRKLKLLVASFVPTGQHLQTLRPETLCFFTESHPGDKALSGFHGSEALVRGMAVSLSAMHISSGLDPSSEESLKGSSTPDIYLRLPRLSVVTRAAYYFQAERPECIFLGVRYRLTVVLGCLSPI